jgi:acetyltransferase-like isoleucine patch superfamily enzyme
MIFHSSFLYRTLHVLRLRRRFPLSVIYPGVLVDASSEIGKHAVLFSNTRLIGSSMGIYSYVQENTRLFCADVGPYCSIGANVSVGMVNHPVSMISTSPVFYDNTQPLPRFFVDGVRVAETTPRTSIEADVWVGEGSLIRAGVKLGVGAVIGAGSVVTKDIPPYAIAAGVPCRTIKPRFDVSLCERLLASGWWNLDEEKLLALAPLYSNPVAFVEAVEKNK